MQPHQPSELPSLIHSNPAHFRPQFGISTNTSPAIHQYLQNLPNLPHQTINLAQQTCFSSANSTSDEADEQQMSIINERKQRRMISNRESARRSRMRKQKHLDELWSQVVWLRNENHQLMDKLSSVCENHDRVLMENAKLKEEALELREMLSGMQISSPFSRLREIDFDNESLE